jgi:hypothetical protein
MTHVTHEQALAHYFMLGAGRSLEKLRRHYTGLTPPKPVSIDTLKFWSRRHGWAAKAAAHDQEVTQRLAEKANRQRAKGEWDKVEALLAVARRCLDLVKDAQLGVATTAQDCRALTAPGVEAMKMAEVLTGGVSDRIAAQSSEATNEAMKSLDAIERRLRSVPKEPPTDAA